MQIVEEASRGPGIQKIWPKAALSPLIQTGKIGLDALSHLEMFSHRAALFFP